MPLGPVGEDDPPQAETIVASVAPEAIWQAPAQNRRREMEVCSFGIALILSGTKSGPGDLRGKFEAASNVAGFPPQAATRRVQPITDWYVDG